MIGTTPIGNTYTFLGAVFGWLFSRPVSFLARRSRPLSVLLKEGRCECLWYNMALLLFSGVGFVELLDDSSSSTGISALSGMMGFFPLSPTVGCFACLLSCASHSPRLCLFSTLAWRRSFSRCRCSAILQFPYLPCFFLLLLLHIFTAMKKLVFGRLNHRIA